MLKLIKSQTRGNDPLMSMLVVLIAVPLGTCLLLLAMAFLKAVLGILY